MSSLDWLVTSLLKETDFREDSDSESELSGQNFDRPARAPVVSSYLQDLVRNWAGRQALKNQVLVRKRIGGLPRWFRVLSRIASRPLSDGFGRIEESARPSIDHWFNCRELLKKCQSTTLLLGLEAWRGSAVATCLPSDNHCTTPTLKHLSID